MFNLPPGYVRRTEVPAWDDFAHDQGGVVWQPKVYELAAEIAVYLGKRQLVDLGCGTAFKSVDACRTWCLDLLGIDSQQTVDWLNENQPGGVWMPYDFDDESNLVRDLAGIVPENAVIVAADVIEHLQHPDRFLALIAACRPTALVLSTPDRLLTRGPGDFGPPSHKYHAQEWTLSELIGFLDSEGWWVDYSAWTQSSTKSADENTALVVAWPS